MCIAPHNYNAGLLTIILTLLIGRSSADISGILQDPAGIQFPAELAEKHKGQVTFPSLYPKWLSWD